MKIRAIPSALLLLTITLPGPLAQAAGKPNFLFLITDDQRWDALGVVQREQGERARFPWFKTPNLDRLAEGGARFRQAFVVNSLCSPSRASILTGQYSHANGVPNNVTAFPAENTTYATLLKKAGYVTGYIGKWHMGGQTDRPGFDYAATYAGQGTYFNTSFLVNGKATVSDKWVDYVATDFAVDFLQMNKDHPFALVVGFKSPHDPQRPSVRNRTLYTGDQVKAAPNSDTATPFHNNFDPAQTTGTTEKMLNYFRCLAGVDESVGRLLDTLDELGLSENTVVVFIGDNGYYLGEHRLLDKRSAYEESMRIPFLLRYPPLMKKGEVIDQTVLNIDFAPTFLALAGLPIPPEMQGKSLVPLVEGRDAPDWRKAFLYEYFYDNTYDFAPAVLALRRDDAKLITYPGHPEWTEVFDLAHDPYETKNLASEEKYRDLRAQLEAELEKQQKDLAYHIPANVEVRALDGNQKAALKNNPNEELP